MSVLNHPITLYMQTTQIYLAWAIVILWTVPGLAEPDRKLVVPRFSDVDTNEDGQLSLVEFKKGFGDTTTDGSSPFDRLFGVVDRDGSGSLNETELDFCRKLFRHFDSDAEQEFVPYSDLTVTIDDVQVEIHSAMLHAKLCEDDSLSWPESDVSAVPDRSEIPFSTVVQSDKENTLQDIINASVVLSIGKEDVHGRAGGVIISEDGLMVTNFHVAKSLGEKRMTAMTPDGKSYRVVEFLAGNSRRDVALLRLEGSDFPFVGIAPAAPQVADDYVTIHHSEGRFFTYDKGYIMRYAHHMNQRFVEVSADYAPGGSGCGLFDSRNRLFGLVCQVFRNRPDRKESTKVSSESDDSASSARLLKVAVPHSAVASLFVKE